MKEETESGNFFLVLEVRSIYFRGVNAFIFRWCVRLLQVFYHFFDFFVEQVRSYRHFH